MPAERPEDFVLRVSRRIGQVRRAKGLTQDEMAEKLGTATRAFQRIEAGQNLTLYTLARIAGVLGVRPDDLLAAGVDRHRHRTAKPDATAGRRPPAQATAEPRGRRARRN